MANVIQKTDISVIQIAALRVFNNSLPFRLLQTLKLPLLSSKKGNLCHFTAHAKMSPSAAYVSIFSFTTILK